MSLSHRGLVADERLHLLQGEGPRGVGWERERRREHAVLCLPAPGKQ